MKHLLLAMLILASTGTSQARPGPVLHLGQKPPGTTPEVFAPGVVSTGNIHSRLEITPDGRELFWNTVNMQTFSTRILSARIAHGKIAAAQPPSFAKGGDSRGAVLSPGGRRLFFNAQVGQEWVIRYVDRTVKGWSAPRDYGSRVNASSSFTRTGRAYFSAEMKGKAWDSGIYSSRYSAEAYSDVVALDSLINVPNAIDYTPYVSPDESFLLFSSNRPLLNDKEDMHIYVSFRLGAGAWSTPARVSEVQGRFPSMSPDQRFLFFCGEDGNFYWADKGILEPFRRAAMRSGAVHIESGGIEGVPSGVPGVLVFRGVPYARPPVGALRWQPPQPPAAWSGVRRADGIAPCCQQVPWSAPPWTAEFVTQERTSEDCLDLNLWTAKAPGSAKRPVLLWLHGGALTGGSGAVAVYDGAQLARRGLVVVTVNYRLGALGFLAHPGLSAESPRHVSGNYGLLDCIAALQWVRRNIAAFGGDPGRVTLAGQSSGADLAAALIRSPLATGLFHRAILMSGGSSEWYLPLAEAEQSGAAWGRAFQDSSLAALRALPAAGTLVAGRFGLVADGWCLPANESTAPASDVPILFGMTADEGSSESTYGKATAAEFTALARAQLDTLADEALRLYPFSNDEQAGLAQKQSARDLGLFGTLRWARTRAARSHGPLYVYYFTRGIPWPEHPEFGAFHSSDVPYAFANLRLLRRPWQEADRRLSETLAACWVRFARTGDPNGPGLPEWPAFDAGKPRLLELGETVAARSILEPRRVEFYEKCMARRRRE